MSVQETKLCRCGCLEEVFGKGSFLPGHDLKAALRVITDCYGTIESFLEQHEGQ